MTDFTNDYVDKRIAAKFVEHPLLRFVRNKQFQQLLAYCRTHPRDTTCRGELADWLEENGESEYAAWLRYECGLWEIPVGYNYSAYRKQLFASTKAIFAVENSIRRKGLVDGIYVGGMLTEYRQLSLDNWLTFGKLAYAVGCVRRVEIDNTIWPMCRSNSTSSWSSGSRGTINNLYACDGFQVNTSIHGGLYQSIVDQLIKKDINFLNWKGDTSPITVLNAVDVQRKLTRIISNAAILHAKHSAIADGIACY